MELIITNSRRNFVSVLNVPSTFYISKITQFHIIFFFFSPNIFLPNKSVVFLNRDTKGSPHKVLSKSTHPVVLRDASTNGQTKIPKIDVLYCRLYTICQFYCKAKYQSCISSN